MQLFVGAKAMVEHDGRILIVRESGSYEDGTQEGRWDVPGGRIKVEERVFDGLCREVLEETGLSITPINVVHVAENFPTLQGELCHIIRIYFACVLSEESINVTLSDDHDAYQWIVPEEHTAYALIASKSDSVHDAFEAYLSANKCKKVTQGLW